MNFLKTPLAAPVLTFFYILVYEYIFKNWTSIWQNYDIFLHQNVTILAHSHLFILFMANLNIPS